MQTEKCPVRYGYRILGRVGSTEGKLNANYMDKRNDTFHLEKYLEDIALPPEVENYDGKVVWLFRNDQRAKMKPQN